MIAPTPTVGPTEMPRSPWELAREQYARQLLDDIRDALAAADCACPPGDGTCEDWRDSTHRWEQLAAAVVRLVYPTLAEVTDRDTPEQLRADALGLIVRLPSTPSSGVVARDYDAVVGLVARLLGDLRRLYDDAQNVRDQYGAETRRARDERDADLHELWHLRGVVRRVKRTVRPIGTGTDCDGLLAAVREVRRHVRNVRVGREP